MVLTKKAITPAATCTAREPFREMLLEINQPAQALEQIEATLKKGKPLRAL